jgi:hypothetical protein
MKSERNSKKHSPEKHPPEPPQPFEQSPENVQTEGTTMEAKVDIRKLQLLNDRINQTIDALNQVRLSVHGLAHSQYQGPLQGQLPGLGFGSPFGGQLQGYGPLAAQGIGGFGGWGQVPQQSFGGWPQVQPGFSHSSGVDSIDPSRQIYAQWLLQQQLQAPIDPYYGVRVQQTFPFAAYPLSPVG